MNISDMKKIMKLYEEFLIQNKKFNEVEEITEEMMNYLKGLNKHEKDLFFVKGVKKNGNSYYYPVNMECKICGEKKMKRYNKTKIYELLAEKIDHVCVECEAKEKQNRKEQQILRDQQYEEEREQAYKYYLESVLSPDTYWKKDVSYWQRLNYIRQFSREIKVIEKLKELDYKDFLKTLYWKTISNEVKKRNNFKCSICGEKTNLVVHHSAYEHHGEEADHLKDLVCICQNCHEIYHNKESQE